VANDAAVLELERSPRPWRSRDAIDALVGTEITYVGYGLPERSRAIRGSRARSTPNLNVDTVIETPIRIAVRATASGGPLILGGEVIGFVLR
jgi:hypothetical protein